MPGTSRPGQDLRNAIFSDPRPVAVPEPVGRYSLLDRKPAGERDVLRDLLDAPASWRGECVGAWLGAWPGGRGEAGPGY
jgi:hypothetical protein